MALLEITDLEVFYGKARSINGVSLRVNEGQIVGIIGPNGAGKSTLLDTILGLTDHKGSIRFDNSDLSRLSTAQIVKLGIGYAPERRNLFPFMNVRENLLTGAYVARDQLQANLQRVFELFPRLEERQNQEAATQSGGEQQMLSLGRALMANPKLLLVDEPTIGLAPRVCKDIATVLQNLNQQAGLTIVITEQNVNFAMSLAEEIHLLETGRVRMTGTADELRNEQYIKETYFGI
jgi:branched-chain amino acid transport system ATP-binding protein